MSRPSLYQLDHGESDDPDHVDEVPVQSKELYWKVVFLCELAIKGVDKQPDRPDDADQNVSTVKARQREKGHPEDTAWIVRGSAERHPFTAKVTELNHLNNQENHAQDRRQDDTSQKLSAISLLDCGDGAHYCKTASQ